MKKIFRDILFVQNHYQQHLGIMQISALLKKNGFTTDVSNHKKQPTIFNHAIRTAQYNCMEFL